MAPPTQRRLFEAKRICEGVEAHMRIRVALLILKSVPVVIQMGKGTLQPLLQNAIVPLTIFLTCLPQERVWSAVKTRPFSVGVGLQVLPLVVLLARQPFCYAAMDPLLQHRLFLSTAVPLFHVYSLMFHVPDGVFFAVLIPSFLMGWMIHHQLAGGNDMYTVALGVFNALVASLLRHLAVEAAWKNFKLAAELEEAHAKLQGISGAQAAMLSSMFDASCECDCEGQILRVSPHLQELLLGVTSPSSSLQLPGYTVSEAEEQRLQEFLTHAASNATQQAAAIAVTFCKGGRPSARKCDGENPNAGDSGAEAPSPAPLQTSGFEAKVYGVRLPGSPVDIAAAKASRCAADPAAELRGHLFLGFQVIDANREQLSPLASPRSAGTHIRPRRRVKPQTSTLQFQPFAGSGLEKPAVATRKLEQAFLSFDAGTPELQSLGGSILFGGIKSKAGSCLAMVPPDWRQSFDRWVYREVAAAPFDEHSVSSSYVRSLELLVPARPAGILRVEAAWLEIAPASESLAQDGSGELPVSLVMEGVHWRGRCRTQLPSLLPCIEESTGNPISPGGSKSGDEDGSFALYSEEDSSSAHG